MERIRLLERLIENLDIESHEPDQINQLRLLSRLVRESRGRRLRRKLGDLRADLEAVLSEEKELTDGSFEWSSEGRPPSIKNASAKRIYEALEPSGTTLWKACAVIADMFVTANIDTRPPERVRRSLYHSLKRAS